MIVSSRLDTNTFRGAKHIKTVPQYDKNDSGEAEPGDYAQPPQVPTFTQAHKIRKPSLPAKDLGVPKLDYVPLKCDQYNSRPDGSALFNASTPAYTAPLDIEYEMPSDRNKFYYAAQAAAASREAKPYPYGEGIRPASRPIKFDSVNEPTADMFRRDYRPAPNHSVPHINYDLGVEELREMARRQH